MASGNSGSDVLALLRLASGLLTGPSGRDLQAAIRAGRVTQEEVGCLQGLGQELQALAGSNKGAVKASSHSSESNNPDDGSEMIMVEEEEVSCSSFASSFGRCLSGVTDDEDSKYPASIVATTTATTTTAPSSPFSFPSSTSVFASNLHAPHPPPKRMCPPVFKRAGTAPSSLSSSSSSSFVQKEEGKGKGGGIESLPDGTLLSIFDFVWSGRPSYGENDGRKQLGDISLVCRRWRDLATSDELWKPLCIARWPWLKSLKGGPAELLPPLAVYRHQGQGGRSPQVWHEFCVRHGRCMNKAGIGRGTSWTNDYALSVEIFDRKGGFRLFCSYGRVSVVQQNLSQDGGWLTKLAVTGFASCWHFSAASRDPTLGRFENIQQYFERCHERHLEHCLCTEVTVMNKQTGKMAVLYASSKETKRKLTAEKGNTAYFEEELRPAHSSSTSHPALPTEEGLMERKEAFTYLAGSGMAVSKVLPPGVVETSPTTPLPAEQEKEQKWRVDRLYLIYSTAKRWDVNKIFAGLDWA